MNENNNNSSSNITPYKATGNLNTAIGNPRININDTMNINIQSMATNTMVSDTNHNNNQLELNSQVQLGSGVPNNTAINNVSVDNGSNNGINNIQNNDNNKNNINYIQNQNNSVVKKTYVNTDNKPKKKNISLNLGPEFKIALLIIVILLVFIFLLPVISDMFNGY